MSTFKRIAGGITTSAAVIPATIAVVALIVVGIYAMFADYNSTRLGIESFGLRTAVPDEIKFLAIIPQAVQIVIVYILGTRDLSYKVARINVLIYIVALVFDQATDVYHKANGLPFEYWIIAFFVTLMFYTVGSEVLTITCISIFFEIFPTFLEKITEFFTRVLNILGRSLTWLFSEADDDGSESNKASSSPVNRLGR